MTEALADMALEKHSECIGMWCEAGGKLSVIRGVYHWSDGGLRFRLINPATDTLSRFTPMEAVTLRPDLPRAWEPDGTPWEGEHD
ncbi:hypothetical protein [Corynebacterium liangguodongii]|uniref:Uncharacterized protein n=1 Tax=Corynebacterium liangguodongii TaxID=2079535 RepID=A0A2S0WGA0_9CORY|nr:hypothetical protein [Corynebacterium liangguodongii]AWB84801.1 hypothetical protein C3E79_10215 [Corynebacterium liangguodongii]PWB99158.1 hypothetical protein DF219_07830 [Corynebacterium liangguodongii]